MDYIIDFKNNVSKQEIKNYLLAFGATITKSFLKFENVYCIQSNVAPPPNEIVEHVFNDSENPIQLLDTTIQSDQSYAKIVTDGSLPMINVPNNNQNWWKFYTFVNPDLNESHYVTNRRGSNSIVYVLDSGIEITHPEFEGQKVFNLWSFTGDFTDTKGHGTAIASVIAGKTCGITDATVKSVKIFDSNVATKQSDMLAGLDAIFNDAINYENVIVNCSWIISKNIYIENKIKMMSDAGIFFVAAAGNNGSPIENITPASIPEVLTIGSYNNELKPSNFSNYTSGSGISLTAGPTNHGKLDGWAPGELIWAAGLNGSYHNVFGTSIAAGIHSAVLAYNLYLLQGDPIRISQKNMYASASLKRRGLLDLSDPKYADSVNKISTILDYIQEVTNEIPLGYIVSSKPGFYMAHLFNPHKIQEITIKDDLPEWLTINNKGNLYGTVPAITEKVKIISLPIVAKYYTGEIESYDFKFVIKNPEFDATTDSTGDPVLDLALQESFSCWYESGCYTAPDTCNNDCPIGGFNFCTFIPTQPNGCPKGQAYCYCEG